MIHTDVRAFVVKQFMARKILGTGMPEITIVAKNFNLDEKTYETRIKGIIRHAIDKHKQKVSDQG